MLTNSAIAVFSAVLGSAITLIAVDSFSNADSARYADDALEAKPVSEPYVSARLMDTALELEKLQAALSKGEAERAQMAETLEQITRDLADLQEQLSVLEQVSTNRLALAPLGSDVRGSDTQQAEGTKPRTDTFGRQRPTGQGRVESLIAAGLDEQTALNLQARYDQLQLARLELLDQAAREGWSDSEQLQQRMSELEERRVDLRDELGDDGFDRFLYESGDANRVRIESVISESAADIAGLAVGDLIIGYNDQRIFRARELQQATREGSRGEYVQVVFDRGGQLLSTTLPRGPMGVTLGTTAVAP